MIEIIVVPMLYVALTALAVYLGVIKALQAFFNEDDSSVTLPKR